MRTPSFTIIAAATIVSALPLHAQDSAARPPQSWLGFSYTTSMRGPDDPREVTVVLDVVEGSPAESSGLLAGDTLVRVNNLRATTELLSSLRYSVEPGDEVRLRVRRAGAERTVTVRAAERPADMMIEEPWTYMIDIDSLRGRVKLLLDSTRARVLSGKQVLRLTDPDRTIMFDFRARPDSIRWNAPLNLRLDTLGAIRWRVNSLSLRNMFQPAVSQLVNFETFGGALLGQYAIAGAMLSEVDEALGEYFAVDHGLLVLRVPDGTPAERAGLEPGDVIVSVGGEPVASVGELRRAIRSARGEQVTLDIVRHGERSVVRLPKE